MKKKLKFLNCVLLAILIVLSLCSCGAGAAKTVIDYGDAESFEAALNAGENLEGKVVQFTAVDFRPDSMVGYNVWAGEHLNFISERNPDIKTGDTVVVKANEITSSMGSWFIKYEKVDNAKITEDTITWTETTENEASVETEVVDSNSDAASTGIEGTSSTFSVGGSSSSTVTEELPLEITDYGWYINGGSSYSDSVWVNFCAMIYNPNETLTAEFPKANVTVKNGDGSILSTYTQTGSIVMPGDTITLCGMFSMPAMDISDDAQIIFEADWSDFTSGKTFYEMVRTTDFSFSNVSERNGETENLITGEITNNSSSDLDTVNLSVVLRKDGEIVFMEDTYLYGLKAGQTKAFQIQRYADWPEHDTIECSARP